MERYGGTLRRELCERQHSYAAAKHQRFVGTGYFDEVQNVITGGTASTTALAGSTEAEQFHDLAAAIRQQPQPTFGTANAND